MQYSPFIVLVVVFTLMDISIYAIVIWVTAIFIVSLDIVIIIGSRNLSSRVFAFFSFLTAIWVISEGFFISSLDYEIANLLIRFQYVLGISIANGFLFFSYIYPYDRKPSKIHIITSSIFILSFVYVYFFTNLIISSVYMIGGASNWAWNFGPLHLFFDISFYLIWIVALYKLYKNYKAEIGKLKLNLKNMFLALSLGIIPPTIVDILLPSLGEFSFNWFGPITSFIWISIVAYSIIKYRQMNVTTVVAEVLAIGMTIIFFINIFTNFYIGIWIRIITFIIFIILAFYLIRISLREAKQREELTLLTSTLSEKVAEQTHEIRKSYELEKKARRDFEKLNETKDQFIMITQHNLRIPMSGIKYELESILSGIYEPVSERIEQSLVNMKNYMNHLVKVVDDFLNISTLRVGSQILEVSEESLKLLIEDVLRELKVDIEALHLSIEYPAHADSWPILKIDSNKMREVLLIIIENAIRYNVDHGKIKIENQIENDIFKMKINNTGIGIVREDKENLFERLFFRSKKAQKVHPSGMGIGLSVSKAILKAHHGDITIHSEGENMGAEVIVTLPLDFLKKINGDNLYNN